MNSKINVGDELLDIIRKNILVILAVGILAALLLSGVRWMFSDNTVKTGNYTFVRMVRVENDEENNQFAVDAFLNSATNYYHFIKNTPEEGFDFASVDSAWKRKNVNEQMNWLKGKIQISSFRGNAFEVVIHFDPNITNDVEYLDRHGDFLADNFVKQSEKTIQEVVPNVSFSVVSSEKTIPLVIEKNQKSAMVKTGIIGFFVGCIGMVAIIFLHSLRKMNQALKVKIK